MGKYFISQIKTSEKFKNKNIEKKKINKIYDDEYDNNSLFFITESKVTYRGESQ